jgi:3'-phosphoadenosine 5'-phosphosulfate (PAPS) 3'-phosphatase
VDFKSCDIDLVTETDKQVEELLISNLKSKFPDHRYAFHISTLYIAYIPDFMR